MSRGRPALSDDEHVELLTLLARGRTARQAARALGLTPTAVGMRLMRLREARGCETTLQLVAQAVRDGEVAPW